MAIPNDYIDKITNKDSGESRIISPAADKVRVDNENFEGTDLDEVLDEVAQAIGESGSGDGTVTGVKVGSTTYEPTDGVVDLSTPFGGKVDKENGKGLSSNDYTTQEKNKLAGLSNYDDTALQAAVVSLQNALAALVGGADVQGAIDTFNEVVAFLSGISSSDTLAAKLATLVPQTRTVNGKALSGNVTIGINDIEGLAAAIAAAGSGAVSVTVPDPADGTFTINVGDNSYTINLNHTHENMAKIVKCTEQTLPQSLENDTIYVQVDNATTPTEIESLWLFGLEFTGGGLPSGTPFISKPSGTTINLGENYGSGVSAQVEIRGRYLTGDLTVTVGTGLTVSYGQTTNASSVTIPLANALAGAMVTVSYGGSGALDDGSLVISGGGATTKSVVVVVVEHWEEIDLSAVPIVYGFPGSTGAFSVNGQNQYSGLVDADGYTKMQLTPGNSKSIYLLCKTEPPASPTAMSSYASYLCSGETGRRTSEAGDTYTIDLPSDCKYILFGYQSDANYPDAWKPASVKLK